MKALWQDQELLIECCVRWQINSSMHSPELIPCSLDAWWVSPLCGFNSINSRKELSTSQGEQQTFPLYSHIHLGADWDERCETLKSIKNHKLMRALNFVKERSGDLNMLEPHASIERFQDSKGGHSYVLFEVIQFEGAASLKQVYDATLFFHTNMEITISEKLGHLTVRDDYELEENNIFNFRVVSDDESGLTTESNMALFADVYENLDPDSDPVGVIVTDCVDNDELYPYSPSQNLRKDTTGTIVLTEHRDLSGDLVVVMRRAGFIRLHKPQFDVPPVVMQELRERIAVWGDVMLKTVRDLVYPSM